MTNLDNIDVEQQMVRVCTICKELHRRGYGPGKVRPRSDNPAVLNSRCNDCCTAVSTLRKNHLERDRSARNSTGRRQLFAGRPDDKLKDAAFYAAHADGVKQCRACGGEFGPEKFYNNRTNRDGKQGQCKNCHVELLGATPEQREARRLEREKRMKEVTGVAARVLKGRAA